MRDCQLDEMRDLLPDLAAERLSGAERTRAASHVAACGACAAELELLRAARQAMSRDVPVIDVARIVAALPKPPAVAGDARPMVVRSDASRPAIGARGGRGVHRSDVVGGAAVRPRFLRQWTGWRIAAAATIAVGGLSIAVIRQMAPTTGAAHGASPTAPTAVAPAPSAEPPAVAPAQPAAPSTAATPEHSDGSAVGEASPGLAIGGDISELSDGDVETLLQDMDGLEAQPLTDPDAAVPAIAGAVTP